MEEILKKKSLLKRLSKISKWFFSFCQRKIKGLSRLDKYYPNGIVNFIDSSVFSMEINPAWIHTQLYGRIA